MSVAFKTKVTKGNITISFSSAYPIVICTNLFQTVICSTPQAYVQDKLITLTPGPSARPTKVAQHFFFQPGMLEAYHDPNLWRKFFWPYNPLGVVMGAPHFQTPKYS